MSWTLVLDPVCRRDDSANALELVIEPRRRHVGGILVGRVLPAPERRAIGPFVFFDHMGPAELDPGSGIDVRPHPHINLATITYLFAGEIFHRDSLGSQQAIRPGDINWMTAGRGIVHSERTTPERRKSGGELHGIQLWVALPEEHEEDPPQFHHHPRESLPSIEQEGATVRLLVGSAFGQTSPVRIYSPMFYADVEAETGARVTLPSEHDERACYLLEGAVVSGRERFEAPCMLVFASGGAPELCAERASRMMLLGGAPLGQRFIWWNFVSSSEARIEEAKRAWKEQRFEKIPGDDIEFLRLPDI